MRDVGQEQPLWILVPVNEKLHRMSTICFRTFLFFPIIFLIHVHHKMFLDSRLGFGINGSKIWIYCNRVISSEANYLRSRLIEWFFELWCDCFYFSFLIYFYNYGITQFTINPMKASSFSWISFHWFLIWCHSVSTNVQQKPPTPKQPYFSNMIRLVKRNLIIWLCHFSQQFWPCSGNFYFS